MADATLNSSIAEHQALQITLRDDLSRFGIILSGDHLTTTSIQLTEPKYWNTEVSDTEVLAHTYIQKYWNTEVSAALC